MTIVTTLAAGSRSAPVSRRAFARALEAAQGAGITIDAWFTLEFGDPDLSARADWAGLNA